MLDIKYCCAWIEVTAKISTISVVLPQYTFSFFTTANPSLTLTIVKMLNIHENFGLLIFLSITITIVIHFLGYQATCFLIAYFITLGHFINYFGTQATYFIVAYFITLKYFVHNPLIFTTMFMFKYLIPLSCHFISIGDLRFSHRSFVHWTELYSSGNLSFGDLIEFNRNSYETT